MSGNKISYTPQFNEDYNGHKTRGQYFEFILNAIQQTAVNVNAFPNGDIMQPAMHFAITFPKTPDVTVRIEGTKITKMDPKGLWLMQDLSVDEYNKISQQIQANYPECDRAIKLFDQTFVLHKQKPSKLS